MATPSAALVDLREKSAQKTRELKDVFELAQDGKVFDFSRKTVLEKLGATDATHATQLVKERNKELDDIGAELHTAEMKFIQECMDEREEQRNIPIRGAQHPQPAERTHPKTLGELYSETKEYKESVRQKIDIPVTLDFDVKTLFQTTAGFPPESLRTGRIVEAVTRPVQVLDLIPSFDLGDAVEKYMEETTRTHAAAEKDEGVAYTESTFVFTEKTSTARKITDSLPVTDEQLEDETQVRRLIDQRLRFGLMQRLDLQVLVGDGIAPNLLGINNTAGVQTQAKGTDSALVAFLKGLTLIRFTGRANPNGAVAHPNDWQDIILTQDAEGRFLFGNPFQGPGPQSLFGIPIAQSDAQTENTVLIGDFGNFCAIGNRRGVSVQTGYVGTQFTEGKITLRADVRVSFTTYRPAAFCQVTGV